MTTPSEWHREIAVATFNRSWDLLEGERRTAEDDEELLVAVFTSRFHWGQAGTAENVAIADNQIARAAAALGDGALAVRFATRALDRTEAEGWTSAGDWRFASALEICARAYAAEGNAGLRDEFLARARHAAAAIADADERQVIEAQIATVPT